MFVFKQNTANHVTSITTGFAASSTIGTCKPNFCSSRSRKYFKCAGLRPTTSFAVIRCHLVNSKKSNALNTLNNRDDSLQKHKEIEWSQSDSLTVWQFDLKHFVSKCPAEVVPLRRTCCASSSSASCSPGSDQKHNESILDPLDPPPKKTRLFRSWINSKFLIPRVSKVPILIFFNFLV